MCRHRPASGRVCQAIVLGLSSFLAAAANERAVRVPAPVIERLPDAGGLKNLHRAGTAVLSGSEPHGEESLKELRRLGVQTIVSVDGAPPAVEAARRHGLRYIHIPIGYDGVPAEAVLKLARVAHEISPPVYVHCHHGKHRGPAAAAVICRIRGELSAEQALEFLSSAGTSPEYPGLWRDVRDLQIPDRLDVSVALPEIADMHSMAVAMASLDRAMDHLKQMAATGWQAPADHPDLDPVAEAVLVREGLTESARHAGRDLPEQLRTWLHEATREARELESAFRSGDSDAAARLFKSLEASCRRCHVEYRNHGCAPGNPGQCQCMP